MASASCVAYPAPHPTGAARGSRGARRSSRSLYELRVNKGCAPPRRHRNSCADGTGAGPGEDRARQAVGNFSSAPWDRAGGRGGARASQAPSPPPDAAPPAAGRCRGATAAVRPLRSRVASAELAFQSCPVESPAALREPGFNYFPINKVCEKRICAKGQFQQ